VLHTARCLEPKSHLKTGWQNQRRAVRQEQACKMLIWQNFVTNKHGEEIKNFLGSIVNLHKHTCLSTDTSTLLKHCTKQYFRTSVQYLLQYIIRRYTVKIYYKSVDCISTVKHRRFNITRCLTKPPFFSPFKQKKAQHWSYVAAPWSNGFESSQTIHVCPHSSFFSAISCFLVTSWSPIQGALRPLKDSSCRPPKWRHNGL
jgi:hypothetical protein